MPVIIQDAKKERLLIYELDDPTRLKLDLIKEGVDYQLSLLYPETVYEDQKIEPKDLNAGPHPQDTNPNDGQKGTDEGKVFSLYYVVNFEYIFVLKLDEHFNQLSKMHVTDKYKYRGYNDEYIKVRILNIEQNQEYICLVISGEEETQGNDPCKTWHSLEAFRKLKGGQ